MNYRIKDKFFDRIKEKIEDGTFTEGKNCKLTRYYIEKDIREFPLSERTPEICSSLIAYSRCRLSDVPESSKTRELFIDSFTSNDVYDYIKNHIADFDRDFFKDLIASNEYATHFKNNCFALMPIEYIDEEMCSLAILCSIDWSCDNWFLSVYKRKPEALTADLWKLGARLYARLSGEENSFLNITPEEYKDTEYYKEMCSCNFNCGVELNANKGKIMDSIPQEVLTPEFLIDLLISSINNVANFNERALETEVIHTKGEKVVCEKIWQLVVRLKGDTIKDIKLNDERVEFFLSHYDKDSSEYRWDFKDNYKKYKKEKDDAAALAQTQQTTQRNAKNTAACALLSALMYSMEGEDPTKAIEDEIDRKEEMNLKFIPIKYRGIIPQKFCKEYDSEEYLEMLYRTIGIQIIEEYDDLFYRVNLPEGWSGDSSGYWNYVKDNNGNTIIEYFYDSKFYERDAYVKVVNIPKEKTSDSGEKVLVKKNKKVAK